MATPEEALNGAKDILAEGISDNADFRTHIRELTMKHGQLLSAAKDPDAESVYEMYYDFNEGLSKLAGHRILAINRGEKEKFLTVKIEAPTDRILSYLDRKIITNPQAFTAPVLHEALEDAYNRLIAPAIEREIRNDLFEKAEDGAIRVFGKNLEQLLMQPPIAGQVVLGWDPAFRTGCKLAVVDPTGKVLDTTVIYPTAPAKPRGRSQSGTEKTDFQIPYYINLSGKRYCFPRIRADHCTASQRDSGTGTIHHRKRSRCLRILCQQAGNRRIPAV